MLIEVAAEIKAKAPFLNPNTLPKNANAVLKTIIFLFSDKCNQKKPPFLTVFSNSQTFDFQSMILIAE